MIKNKLKNFIVILLLISMLFPNFAFALDINSEKQLKNIETNEETIINSEEQSDSNVEEISDEEKAKYSKEYIEYLNLSEEEKSKVTIIPRKYDIPIETLYEDTFSEEVGYSAYGINNQNLEEEILPDKFDLRDYIDIPTKNQGPYGLCGDFAAIRSLETNLALHGYGDYDFSEWHLAYIESNGFYKPIDENTGGLMDYLINNNSKGYGPVLESEVPYGQEIEEKDYGSLFDYQPKAYINEYVEFPTIIKGEDRTYTDEELELFRKKVKQHIMKNGSLFTAISSESIKFNTAGQNVLYCNLSKSADHAISIIGWDDNYSKNNFKYFQNNGDGNNTEVTEIPENDGAYIAINSWGKTTEIIYISYEDRLVDVQLSGIVSSTTTPEMKETQFEDENLYNAIKEQLGKNVISFDDEKLEIQYVNCVIKNLELSKRDIRSLKGLENFSNLVEIDLSYNNLEDISVLWNLKKLISIDVSNNKISTLGNLSNMVNLVYLDLSDNNLDNVSDVINFPQLKVLTISNNKVKDISFVENMDNLKYIYINDNRIEDISPLEKLYKKYNYERVEYCMTGNPIKKGLEKIIFDECEILTLTNCELDDSIIEVLANLKNLNAVYLGNNNIKDVSKLSQLNLDTLDLSGNKELNLNTLKDFEGSMLFLNDCNISDITPLSQMKFEGLLFLQDNPITDISPLKDKYLSVLSLGGMESLNVSLLNNISSLELADIENLEGLSNLNNLIDLTISNCKLKENELLPSNLRYLYIYNCDIENINDLLCNLEYLDCLSLTNTNVSNLEAIQNLTNLTNLILDNNNISNIESLSNLVNLSNLTLNNNNISNIESLSNLVNLNRLSLNDNNIDNIEPLRNLTNIVDLYINNNLLTNIDVILDMPNLRYALFKNNKIENIENLEDFDREIFVNLEGNNIIKAPNNENCKNWNYRFENITKDVNVKKDSENIIKLPFLIKKEYLERYRKGYEKRTIFNFENCEVDFEKEEIKIVPTELGNGTAKIEINLKDYREDDESEKTDKIKTYTINYNSVESLNLEKIFLNNDPQEEYIEGESVDRESLEVRALYEGEVIQETDNYYLEGADNLVVGEQEIKIISTENPECQIVYIVQVYSKTDMVEVTIQDSNLFNALINESGYYDINNEEIFPIICYNNDLNKIYYSKEIFQQINELSICAEYIENIDGLEIFNNLKTLYINVDEINSISNLENMENLEFVYIENAKNIKNIVPILNKNNFEKIWISSRLNIENCEDVEYVDLPDYMYEAVKLGENAVTATLNYISDKNYFTLYETETDIEIDEENQKIKVKLDKEVLVGKYSGIRYISVNINGSNYSLNSDVCYKVEESADEKEKLTTEIKDLKDIYIENMLPNTRIFELRNKISTNGKVEFYQGDERIYDVTKKVATGMIVRIFKDEESCEYKTVITGDLTGNGECQDADLLKLARYKTELDTNLKDEYLEASDIDQNNENAEDSDLLKLARILVGLDNF